MARRVRASRGSCDPSLLLFIRHFLKLWIWVEVLSKLMLPLAVFVLSHPPSPSFSAPVSSALVLLPPALSTRAPWTVGRSCGERREQLLRQRKESESRGGRDKGLKLWNSLNTDTGRNTRLEVSFTKDSRSLSRFGYSRLFQRTLSGCMETS